MLSKLLRILLTASSIAPTSFTVAFIGFINHNNTLLWSSLLIGLILCFLCIFIVFAYQKCGETLTKNISSLTPANKEITNYFLAYIFPLLGSESIFSNTYMTIFFYGCLSFYTFFSESYNFNPLLSLFGYRFYEAQDDTGVGFVLLSKQTIKSINGTEFKVRKLTDYIYIYYNRRKQV